MIGEKVFELKLGPRKVVRPGDKVHVKGRRGLFIFQAVVHPTDRRRRPWVDVTCPRTGGTRSFNVKEIRR